MTCGGMQRPASNMDWWTRLFDSPKLFMGMKRKPHLRSSDIYFVCAPSDYWIKVHFVTSNTMMVMICRGKNTLYEKEKVVHKKSISIEDFDRSRDLKRVVKNFCEYFISRYGDHSDLETREASNCLSACYTKYGLKIWTRKRTNPYI